MASIPEDRIAEGLATGATVAENLVATRLDDARFVRHGLLDLRQIRANAERLIERYSVRVGGPAASVATLSGGNMQKVVVARELSEQPKVLLVSQPTRGVDLTATQFIWRSLTEARDAGAAILLSSADLSELLALSRPAGRVLSRPHRRGLPELRRRSPPEMLGACMLGLSDADRRMKCRRRSHDAATASTGNALEGDAAARRCARSAPAAIALGVAFVIILLTSSAPLEAFSTLVTAPISRVRTIGLWIDDVAKLTVTGLAFSLVFQARQFAMGVQGQVYVGRAGGQLYRAVAGRPDLARHSARRAVRDDGRRLLGLPARHRQGAARRQRDRLVADVQLHRDRAHQLSGADPAGAAGQRRADHQCLSADRGVPGAGPQHRASTSA